ncbi:MAG: DUF5343 domain-containing protein [Acidobacteriota bacterium]
MADDDKQLNAAYVGWTTFKNALDQLSQGLPHYVNKDLFSGQSWGVQGQIMSTLRFLGLTGGDGAPTPDLIALAVPDEEERKRQLEKVIRERYADLFALDLMKVTPSQLLPQINASYGNTGDSRDKAMRFFLGAVGYLGIPVSRFLKVPKTGNGGTSRKKRSHKAKPTTPVTPPEPVSPAATTPQGTSTSKTIKLETPGMPLTLVVPGDFGSLTSADRKFIFDLMEKLDDYEQKKASSGQGQTNAGGEE